MLLGRTASSFTRQVIVFKPEINAIRKGRSSHGSVPARIALLGMTICAAPFSRFSSSGLATLDPRTLASPGPSRDRSEQRTGLALLRHRLLAVEGFHDAEGGSSTGVRRDVRRCFFPGKQDESRCSMRQKIAWRSTRNSRRRFTDGLLRRGVGRRGTGTSSGFGVLD